MEFRKVRFGDHEIRKAPFSGGFVVVPEHDVRMGEGYLAGFRDGKRAFCYESLGPEIKELGKTLLYRDITPE